MLNEDQRRRLAVKGKVLGRKTLSAIASIVTPDTILRWHRQLVAAKHDYSDRNHKGIDNQLIEFKGQVGQSEGELKQLERLGGMPMYYYRDVA